MKAHALATAILAKVEERALGKAAPVKDGPSIAELLAASKAAHLTYRQALTDRRVSAANAALADAATQRANAELADPNHTDPAWADSGATHNASGHISHADLHDDLLMFYANKLDIPTHG